MERIDLAAASRFLAALSADREFTFQTFDDSTAKRRELNRTAPALHGPFGLLGDRLARLNAQGAGVFVMVNRGDGKGRKAQNVVECRALFLDLDGEPLDPVVQASPPPSIVTESSPGRFHCYWPCVDLPVDRFRDAQKALAARFSGDPKVHDLPRVMRLPGFVHAKAKAGHTARPFVSRLLKCEDAHFTWAELVEAFQLPDRMRLPDLIPEGQRNDILYRLAVSAAHKGISQMAQLSKARAVNAERCQPPLEDAEVVQIVASAYSQSSRGTVSVPHAVMDSEAFRQLDHGAQWLYVVALRRVDSFNGGVIPLTHGECSSWFRDKKRFERKRRALVGAGFLQLVRRKGRTHFYRVQNAPIQTSSNGVKKAPLEVLQVGTDEKQKGRAAPNGATNGQGDAQCAA